MRNSYQLTAGLFRARKLAPAFRHPPRGRCTALISALVPLVIAAMAPAAAAQECYQTGWFSEEVPGNAFCRSGYAVRAISCNGRFCDNKQLECCRYTAGVDRGARFAWSPWFSEEGNGQQINRAGFMSGLRCAGRYCDRLSINFIYSPLLSNTRTCRYTPRFSEEAVRQSCSPGEFVAGVRCSGRYCDNLELYCCRASPK